MKPNTKSAFQRYFDFKGNVAPIAEKAHRNLKTKNENEVNRHQRMHHFSIGHKLRQHSIKGLLDFQLDEEYKEERPTRFLHLQLENFPDIKALLDLVNNIRNLNSHYLHDFEKLKVDFGNNPKLLAFLRESFELAVLGTYIEEKEAARTEENIRERITADYTSDLLDQELVNFICDRFYYVSNKQKKEESKAEWLQKKLAFKETFYRKSKAEAIDYILFREVEEDDHWTLDADANKEAFVITGGRYFSFEASLFVLSLFLYKGEANQLISKIKGFKRNEDNEYRSKRNIYSFFAKRFSSQDINSEERHLIKFRDLVQYLNHYPVQWKKELEPGSKNPQMANTLKESIVAMELKRCFPDMLDEQEFMDYAQAYLFSGTAHNNDPKKNRLYRDFLTKNDEVRRAYYAVVNNESLNAYKNTKFKSYALKYVKDSYFRNDQALDDFFRRNRFYWNIESHKKELKENKTIQKLEKRIAKSLLHVSYGRNQDRFMAFAARFLAELDYFGNSAQYKLYQFYNSDEQNKELVLLKERLPKRDYDKLKYHRGKLIHFSSYGEHLQRYPEWDDPFVEEDNAIHIRLEVAEDSYKVVTIQRKVIVYFLQDALAKHKNGQAAGAGAELIRAYFLHHAADFKQSLEHLQNTQQISAEEKRNYKKLLPKRLLHNYSPAQNSSKAESKSLRLVLEQAEEAEKRYAALLEKAEAEDQRYRQSKVKEKGETVSILDDFKRRNKGKQFKLAFIRKACNLMYFREVYRQQVTAANGIHHKHYHISKEEFNTFSKWMHAFDEAPEYKNFLREFFERKGFLDIQEFGQIFEQSTSLSNMYQRVKSAYTEWLDKADKEERKADNYKLKNYKELFQNNNFYLNISHFIRFMEAEGRIERNDNGHLVYPALEQATKLIGPYYYKDKLDKSEYKNYGKLYNKLKAVKLEDALLYNMALYYLQINSNYIDVARHAGHVRDILQNDLHFDIQGHHPYTLVVPFNKLEALVELLKMKELEEDWIEKEEKRRKEKTQEELRSPFLEEISAYLSKVKYDREIKPIWQSYSKKQFLQYHELHSLHLHLITQSTLFTSILLALEHFYLLQYHERCKLPLSGGSRHNRVNFRDIPELYTFLLTPDQSPLPPEDQLNIAANIRNGAFHFTIPKRSYKDLSNDIEEVFLNKEVRTRQYTDWSEMDSWHQDVCSVFLEKLHNTYFDHRTKDAKKKRRDAEKKYTMEKLQNTKSVAYAKE